MLALGVTLFYHKRCMTFTGNHSHLLTSFRKNAPVHYPAKGRKLKESFSPFSAGGSEAALCSSALLMYWIRIRIRIGLDYGDICCQVISSAVT